MERYAMNAIVGNLHDPSWWFTAIFVTIMAGVASGFLKEKIENLISSLSSRYKSWAATRAQGRESGVRVLAENPQFLTLAYINVVAGLLMHVLAVILYLITSVFFDAAPRDIMWRVLAPALGAIATYLGFRATSRFAVVIRALRLYRERNGLPNLP
jgi:hypothetical protein